MITIIGKNSYLAHQVAKNSATKDWLFLSHIEAIENDNWMKNASVVINFSFHPDFYCDDYDPEKDIDRILARRLEGYSCPYIMLSSRAVYGEHDNISNPVFDERMPVHPKTAYAKNKWITEQTLGDLLGKKRLTILRCANIFGYELGRSTFFGIMLQSLHERNEVCFDIAADSQRDFLPVDIFAQYLVTIAKSPQAGLFNIGSGIGVSTQEIGQWMIEYYGGGDLKFSGESYAGQFILDVAKSTKSYSLKTVSKDQIKNSVLQINEVRS